MRVIPSKRFLLLAAMTIGMAMAKKKKGKTATESCEAEDMMLKKNAGMHDASQKASSEWKGDCHDAVFIDNIMQSIPSQVRRRRRRGLLGVGVRRGWLAWRGMCRDH